MEVVREGGNRLCVYGSTCAEVGETAFRNGIVVHQLADEVGDMGPGAGTGADVSVPGSQLSPAAIDVPAGDDQSGHDAEPEAAAAPEPEDAATPDSGAASGFPPSAPEAGAEPEASVSAPDSGCEREPSAPALDLGAEPEASAPAPESAPAASPPAEPPQEASDDGTFQAAPPHHPTTPAPPPSPSRPPF